MALLLRRLKCDPWLAANDAGWTRTEAPGDVLDVLRTDDNRLSLWRIADDRHNLEEVVAALASVFKTPGDVDYVLFREDDLAFVEFDREAKGSTHIAELANSHLDLVNVSAAQLARMANLLFDQSSALRCPALRVVSLLALEVTKGRLKLKLLQPELRESVKARLGAPDFTS